MLFGKTYKQKEEAEQARLKSLYNVRKKTFAWLPTKLQDGRSVWLRTVWVAYPVTKCYDGEYLYKWFSEKSYYLEEK